MDAWQRSEFTDRYHFHLYSSKSPFESRSCNQPSPLAPRAFDSRPCSTSREANRFPILDDAKRRRDKAQVAPELARSKRGERKEWHCGTMNKGCVLISHIRCFLEALSSVNRPQYLHLFCLAQGCQSPNITETHAVQC
jgi:hypothetical protein